MLDKFGQELNEGDYIVYARTVGRSADLGIGRIISYEETHIPERYGRWAWVPSNFGVSMTKGQAQKWVDDNVRPGLEPIDRGSGWRYYDPEKLLTTEGWSYKVQVNSVQGLEFAYIDGMDQSGRRLREWRRDNVTVKKVTLYYPSRFIKTNSFVPEIVLEYLGDKND